MERYRLILKHEYVDEDDYTITDIEDPLECCMEISTLYDSMLVSGYHVIYEMCESIIKYLELEKEGKINDGQIN